MRSNAATDEKVYMHDSHGFRSEHRILFSKSASNAKQRVTERPLRVLQA
jgi:hypothetical protein